MLKYEPKNILGYSRICFTFSRTLVPRLLVLLAYLTGERRLRNRDKTHWIESRQTDRQTSNWTVMRNVIWLLEELFIRVETSTSTSNRKSEVAIASWNSKESTIASNFVVFSIMFFKILIIGSQTYLLRKGICYVSIFPIFDPKIPFLDFRNLRDLPSLSIFTHSCAEIL